MYVITVLDYNLLDTNYVSTNLHFCRRSWHGYPLILYLQSQMVCLDTTKLLLIQQMLNCKISLFWLAGCVPLCLKAHYTRQKCDPPPSAAIREHQVQPKLFLWEKRMGSSIQSVSSLHKSLLHSTFLPEISAEIHLAVRKQLLFVKGSGWCNFNFKFVLNELPPCDWWALRNLPPVPQYPTTEGFNYEPLVLMLSVPVWYASCMWGEWILPPGRSVQYHCTQCHQLKMHCHQSRVILPEDEGL